MVSSPTQWQAVPMHSWPRPSKKSSDILTAKEANQDNKCSKAVEEAYISSQDIDIQLVSPRNHHVNTAEFVDISWVKCQLKQAKISVLAVQKLSIKVTVFLNLPILD